jgi:hypothetical protein
VNAETSRLDAFTGVRVNRTILLEAILAYFGGTIIDELGFASWCW